MTDLDGTLLNTNMSVSRLTVETLNWLMDRGMNISYATSRSHYTASMILSEIHFSLPCITYNGVFVVIPRSGDVMRSNLLDPVMCDDVVKIGDSMGLTPYVFGRTSCAEEKLLYSPPRNIAQCRFIKERAARQDKRLQPMSTSCRLADVINMSYLYPLDDMLRLRAALERDYGPDISIKLVKDIYSSGYFSLEIAHPQANKGAMLAFVCDVVGVPLEHVSVFGDQANDLAMFRLAGTRIAVDNACQEVKESADLIIGGNDEDGVSRYLSTVCGV